MSMKAHIDRDSSGNIIIQMKGDFTYENSAPLRVELSEVINENPTSDITLNMQNIDFVGSSGIGHFVETLRICNVKRPIVRLSNVRTEFIKVFKLYDLTELDLKLIIEDFDNDETEGLAMNFGRRHTFSN